MNKRLQSTLIGFGIGAVLVLGIAVGAIAVLRIEPSGEQGSGLDKEFQYDLEAYKRIDPAMIGYRETEQIPLEMQHPRAIAVDRRDHIYVAGDRAIHVFDADGKPVRQLPIGDAPRCLAVVATDDATTGRIYVGMPDHVEVLEGESAVAWPSLGDRAVLTSIAAAENDVFVADAGNKIVWHYDTTGKKLGRIGERDEARHIPGLVIPSPYCDVALAPDGLLRVVNPGGHRIEAYTFEGDLELAWGKRALSIDGFSGCCNPAHVTVLSDGRIVTAEKGIPRVKVYSTMGDFECVVAGPDTLAPTPTITEETRAPYKPEPVDLAADSQGRILVLDPAARLVRIFQPIDMDTKQTDTQQ
jgi:sugar lactone lactonase YvrE